MCLFGAIPQKNHIIHAKSPVFGSSSRSWPFLISEEFPTRRILVPDTLVFTILKHRISPCVLLVTKVFNLIRHITSKPNHKRYFQQHWSTKFLQTPSSNQLRPMHRFPSHFSDSLIQMRKRSKFCVCKICSRKILNWNVRFDADWPWWFSLRSGLAFSDGQ